MREKHQQIVVIFISSSFLTVFGRYVMEVHQVLQAVCCLWILATCAVKKESVQMYTGV